MGSVLEKSRNYISIVHHSSRIVHPSFIYLPNSYVFLAQFTSHSEKSISSLYAILPKTSLQKMSHSVSNLPISHLGTPQRASLLSKPSYSNSFHLFSPVSSKKFYKGIKAMASEGRDNLDHLQRTTKNQTNQPRKNSGPVAPIGLWDRFPTARTVQQMMDTMERIMEDQFAYNGGWPSPLPPETGGYSRGRTPWEIKEGEGEYRMRFDMPGMTKKDVKIWVEEKMLVVKAEKVPKKKENGKEEEEEEGEWSPKSYGRYNSRIALPENVQFEKIRAEVKDGVLYITIPKANNLGKILDINVE